MKDTSSAAGVPYEAASRENPYEAIEGYMKLTYPALQGSESGPHGTCLQLLVGQSILSDVSEVHDHSLS